MDPYLAKLIGRDKRVDAEEVAPVTDEPSIPRASNVLTWHRPPRAERTWCDVHYDVTKSTLRKVAGLASHTMKYTSRTRTFILITGPLTGAQQRDLLVTDMLVIEHGLREQSLRRGGKR